MRKKLIRKGKIGMTIVDPAQALHNAAQSGMKQVAPMQNALGGQGGLAALLGGQGGFGKQLVGSSGGVGGLVGMGSQLLGAAVSKNAPQSEYQGIEEGVEGFVGNALGTANPLLGAAANLYFKVTDDLARSKGKTRDGQEIVDSSLENIVNPVANVANTIGAGKDLISGKIQPGDALNSILANSWAGRLAGVKDKRMLTAAKEGETYRNLLQQETEADRQRKIEAQRRSQELMADRRSAGWGTMYAKKGGKLPESCGCDKERDGLDTDVFYAMPKELFKKVLRRVNLPEKTSYNDRIKTLIKNSVPKGGNLRTFVESIGDDVKQFIETWENGKPKI